MALRTRVLDAAWDTARAQGARQLVLLGAGLDGRAYRLPNVGDTTLIEVDHPATQQLKRQRAAKLASRAKRHVFVPVDFTADDLGACLQRGGHNPAEPTCWIWEGVTMYLDEPSQKETLEAVARRSCPGSTMAMTYLEPGHTTREQHAAGLIVRLMSEPFMGCMTREQAAEHLTDVGCHVQEDSGLQAWRARYAKKQHAHVSLGERVVVGVWQQGVSVC